MVLKISEKIVNAMINKKNFKSGKRDSVVINNTSKYYLYDTLLIEYIDEHHKKIIISHNNYYTNTTRSRLNQIVALLSNNHYNIRIIKGIYYLFKDGEKLNEINNGYQSYTLYI